MERVMSLLANDISEKKNVILYIVLIGNNREISQSLNSKIIIQKPSWKFNNNRRTWCTFKTLVYIRKTIQKIKPSTVLSFGELWNNMVLLSLIGNNQSVYISDRSRPYKKINYIQGLLRDLLYPTAAGFIAQTKIAMDVAIRRKWNKNIMVIGNPVEANILSSNRKRIILNVGRIIPTKNIDRLIHIYDKSTAKDKNWNLKIVGGDAQGHSISFELVKIVERLGLSNNVHFEGEKINVESYYAECEIFAFTSTSEGFPNALAEAMSAGCACIAYDCVAGPSDIIDNGVNGFLIPEGNEEDYVDKLNLLLGNSELRRKFGDAAKKKMEQFEVSRIANRFFEFITTDFETTN